MPIFTKFGKWQAPTGTGVETNGTNNSRNKAARRKKNTSHIIKMNNLKAN